MRSFLRDTPARRVRFGPGALRHLDEEVQLLGCRRVLVITGGSARSTGEEAAGLLGDRCGGLFDRIRQHVPEELVEEAVRRVAQVEADGVCTVGGGSATGLAKAVARRREIPILAVPTTYAGSEMTPVWGVTGRHKRTGRDRRVAPRAVIYDPELTLDLPPPVTATSGMNALAHAVSVAMSEPDPVASLLAGEAMRVLTRALPEAVRRPRHLPTRCEALYGAYLAASSLEAGRLEGIHHRLCHIVGGTHRLSHAEVHAVLLPHTLAFEQRRDPTRLEPVGAALRVADPSQWVLDLARRIGAPTTLRDIGMPEGGLEEAAERASASLGEEVAEFRDLLDDAYQGRSPTAVPAS